MALLRVHSLVCIFATWFISLVSSACECGYSVNSTLDPEYAVFTDLLESDFTKIKNFKDDFDWRPQVWQLDPVAALGPYGRATVLEAIVPNPAVNVSINATGIYGGQAGLNLLVPHNYTLINGEKYLMGAELDSTRNDMFYGTFRIGYRTTKYPGTCFGFYWYHDDNQEIDIELLSRQINATDTLINLVLHTPVGGTNLDALPGTYQVADLPYNTSAQIHELRFDWTPSAITWYQDGRQIWTISNTTLFPQQPGHIVVTHWSNGNPLWSAGPPEGNAALVLTYVKAYFNSSDSQRQKDHRERCEAVGGGGAVCQIPSPVGPPRYEGVSPDELPYFFSNDPARNATYNQTVYEEKTSGGGKRRSEAIGSGLAVWMLFLQWGIPVLGFMLGEWRPRIGGYMHSLY
ncbi:hypothetical protein H072_1271 [Dactylellina haptotyla CBS 200.50]|uniref:GH16 domain-containing protein n=1 Tax=Dactylellina haptotyla (strain CBS 200.50) TaxID=1284197 RepID=S8CAI8_DACHA|nr:hypothetical protein H072_1271 [Dactylellina haptotyla CBS 200.50]